MNQHDREIWNSNSIWELKQQFNIEIETSIHYDHEKLNKFKWWREKIETTTKKQFEYKLDERSGIIMHGLCTQWCFSPFLHNHAL